MHVNIINVYCVNAQPESVILLILYMVTLYQSCLCWFSSSPPANVKANETIAFCDGNLSTL